MYSLTCSDSLYVLIQPDHNNHLGYLLKLIQTPGLCLCWTLECVNEADLEGEVWESAEAHSWP